MQLQHHIIFLLLMCLTSNVSAQSSMSGTEYAIWVAGIDESVPAGSEKLGSIKIGDGMRRLCDYKNTLELAKEQAYKRGGNFIKLTRHKQPDIKSSCHRIWADVYIIPDSLVASVNESLDTGWKNMLSDTAQYAILCIYRPHDQRGGHSEFRVLGNEQELCNIGDGFSRKIKIYKEGLLTLHTKSEKGRDLRLNIQFGQVYFIKCETEVGILTPVRHMRNIPPPRGYTEFIQYTLMQPVDE